MCIRDRQWEALQYLGALGFPLNPYARHFDAFESALDYAREWMALRETPEYEGDGVGFKVCLLYTSDAADERSSVDLGGCRFIKKKNNDITSSGRDRKKAKQKSRVERK